MVLVQIYKEYIAREMWYLTRSKVTSAEEKAAIQGAHTKTVTAWRKRKRMASDILDSILESWPKSKASLFEDIGVDSDEAVGVKIPK